MMSTTCDGEGSGWASGAAETTTIDDLRNASHPPRVSVLLHASPSEIMDGSSYDGHSMLGLKGLTPGAHCSDVVLYPTRQLAWGI